jgi:hypothetical protein
VDADGLQNPEDFFRSDSDIEDNMPERTDDYGYEDEPVIRSSRQYQEGRGGNNADFENEEDGNFEDVAYYSNSKQFEKENMGLAGGKGSNRNYSTAKKMGYGK